jgi:hypothetical protein
MSFTFIRAFLFSAPICAADAEKGSGGCQYPDRDGYCYFAGGNHAPAPYINEYVPFLL